MLNLVVEHEEAVDSLDFLKTSRDDERFFIWTRGFFTKCSKSLKPSFSPSFFLLLARTIVERFDDSPRRGGTSAF